MRREGELRGRALLLLLGPQPANSIANPQTHGSSDGACGPMDPLISAHPFSSKESRRDADQQDGAGQDEVEGLTAFSLLYWSVLTFSSLALGQGMPWHQAPA